MRGFVMFIVVVVVLRKIGYLSDEDDPPSLPASESPAEIFTPAKSIAAVTLKPIVTKRKMVIPSSAPVITKGAPAPVTNKPVIYDVVSLSPSILVDSVVLLNDAQKDIFREQVNGDADSYGWGVMAGARGDSLPNPHRGRGPHKRGKGMHGRPKVRYGSYSSIS
ncbi:hypothetical protein ORF159R [Singapore grouper iridovirus]|nr:hypothetical protein ORF159R [Singapore grouper iridovirus]